MAVVIRLKRMGANKRPVYRLVVADSRMPRDGRFVEILGVYDPRAASEKIQINAERALQWLAKGAKPSDTVRQLFRKTGILQQFREAQQQAS